MPRWWAWPLRCCRRGQPPPSRPTTPSSSARCSTRAVRRFPARRSLVTHVATGVSTPVVTNQLGQYRTPPLRIGGYDVSVELDGFQRFVQHAAWCSASATCATSTCVLKVGALTDTVTVEADATLAQHLRFDRRHGDHQQADRRPAAERPRLPAAGVAVGGHRRAGVAGRRHRRPERARPPPSCSTGTTTTTSRSRPATAARRRSSSRRSTRSRSSRSSPTATRPSSAARRRASISVSLKSGTNTLHGIGVRVLPRRSLRREGLLRHHQGRLQPAPVRRRRRRSDPAQPDVLLRRRRAQPHPPRRPPRCRRCRPPPPAGPVLAHDHRSADPPAVPRQRDSGRSRSIRRRRASSATCRGRRRRPPTNNFVYNSPSDQDEHEVGPAHRPHRSARRQNVYLRASSQRNDNAATSPLPPDADGNYVVGRRRRAVRSPAASVFVHNARLVADDHQLGRGSAGTGSTGTRRCPTSRCAGVGMPGVDSTQPGFSQIDITGYRSLGVSNVPNADDSTNRPGLGRRHLDPRRAHGEDRRAGLPARRSTSSARSAAAASSTSTASTPATPSPTSCSATRPRRACRSGRR